MTSTLSLLSYLAMVLLGVFFFHAAIANYQLELATKSDNRANLGIALINPYFTKIAEDFRMQAVFNQSNHERNVAGMRFFNNWQQDEIKNRPTFFNYKMLIASYQNLQNREKACASAEQAFAMYKQNEEFKFYVDACQK